MLLMPRMTVTASSAGQQQDKTNKTTEDRRKEEKKSSTDKVPTNEVQRTSLTLRLIMRSATALTEEPAIKIKIINILDRLTKQQQDKNTRAQRDE